MKKLDQVCAEYSYTLLIVWTFKAGTKIKWWKIEYAVVMCIQHLHLFIFLIANFIDYMINSLVEYVNSENIACAALAEPVGGTSDLFTY